MGGGAGKEKLTIQGGGVQCNMIGIFYILALSLLASICYMILIIGFMPHKICYSFSIKLVHKSHLSKAGDGGTHQQIILTNWGRGGSLKLLKSN